MASVTGAHARSWHAGQNSLGGRASAPHLPQRTAVSVPSRARSKKFLSVITGLFDVGGSDRRSSPTPPTGSPLPRRHDGLLTAEQADEDGGEVAAERVGEADAGALDLARAGLTAELRGDLGDLGRARGADRMPLGLEAARGVDGQLAAEGRPSLLGRESARAGLA